MLPNGNGLVVGGDNVDLSDPFLTNGFFSVRVIDPFGQTNTLAPNMPTGRWYPSLLTMPDGTIFIAGGVQVSTDKARHYLTAPSLMSLSSQPKTYTWVMTCKKRLYGLHLAQSLVWGLPGCCYDCLGLCSLPPAAQPEDGPCIIDQRLRNCDIVWWHALAFKQRSAPEMRQPGLFGIITISSWVPQAPGKAQQCKRIWPKSSKTVCALQESGLARAWLQGKPLAMATRVWSCCLQHAQHLCAEAATIHESSLVRRTAASLSIEYTQKLV